MKLHRKILCYEMEKKNKASVETIGGCSKPFLIMISNIEEIHSEKIILELPNCLTISSFVASANDDRNDIIELKNEGCFFYNEKEETILDVVFSMRTIDKECEKTYKLRIPFSHPCMKDEIGLYFDGSWIRAISKDGIVINENSGLDCFCDIFGEIVENYPDNISLYDIKLQEKYNNIDEKMSSAYISPYYYNAYSGDVMNFYYNGEYHLMYLLDRRHHGSRNGNGAHYIMHMTTENLVDWCEQEPIDKIDKPWKSFGTGTMFFYENKYYMSYGLHTERYEGKKEKQTASINAEGNAFLPKSFSAIFLENALPVGATYAESIDGKIFTPCEMVFHESRNPSIYVIDNKLKLFSGYGKDGIWDSDGLGKPFVKSENSIQFLNKIMKNTTECPSYFEWNGFKYLIIGFTGYFRTLKNSEEFISAYELNENIYDGLAVPMVCEYKNNRRLMAGWLNGVGWASIICHRELIQDAKGTLNTKWVEEMLPKTEKIGSFENEVSFDSDKDYYFEINLPKSDVVALQFSSDEKVCNLQFDSKKCTVQISDAEFGCLSKSILPMYEQFEKSDKEFYTQTEINDIPVNSVNFSIPNVKLEDTNRIRILITFVKKIRSTVIDVEINGKHTLASDRKEFRPTKLLTVGSTDSVSGVISKIQGEI